MNVNWSYGMNVFHIASSGSSSCQFSFTLLSILSPVLPFMGFGLVALVSIWSVWYASIHHGIGSDDSIKIVVRSNSFPQHLGKRAKMEIPWCSAVIKNHGILGPSKLFAAYRCLSGGFLP